MNIEDLDSRISDVIKLLEAYNQEAKNVTTAREALEKSSLSNSEREKRLNDLQIALTQKDKDLTSQKQYIDEQLEKNQRILTGLIKEKELLIITKADREKFEDENANLQAREKILEDKTLEFEKQKALFQKQEEATNELMEVLNIREKRIKAKEESLNRRESLSQL